MFAILSRLPWVKLSAMLVSLTLKVVNVVGGEKQVYVVVYTKDNCPPCERFLRDVAPVLRDSGFDVRVRDEEMAVADFEVGARPSYPEVWIVGKRDRRILSKSGFVVPAAYLERCRAYSDVEFLRSTFNLRTELLSDAGVVEVARVFRLTVKDGAPDPPGFEIDAEDGSVKMRPPRAVPSDEPLPPPVVPGDPS
jgi:hypothetical protein